MRRRVSIYKSYSPERRQETAGVQNHRSWVRAPPVVFFPDVGDAFVSWSRRMIYPLRLRVKISDDI